MEEGVPRRRLYSEPEGVIHSKPKYVPDRKRRRSYGDLQMSIHLAYNSSVDGKLDEDNKHALANAFNISEKDVTRKFRNCRNFIEEKARKELIKNAVTSENSPAIEQIANSLKTNSSRVKECLSKYYNKIVSGIQSDSSGGSSPNTPDEPIVVAQGWLVFCRRVFPHPHLSESLDGLPPHSFLFEY